MDSRQTNTSTNEIIRDCPLCGNCNNTQSPSPYSRDNWKIKHCSNCTLVYLENAVPYSELIDNFAWSKSYEKEKKRRKKRNPLLKTISNGFSWLRRRVIKRDKGLKLIHCLITTGRLLDIGCGKGRMLAKLPQTLVPYGIEVDGHTANISNQIAASRGGKVWHNNTISGLQEIKPDFFDGVLMQSYLEHEINPRDVLNGVHRVLRQGGKAIIKVPNFQCWNRHLRKNNWCGFRFPDHVNYFTPSTLTQMITECGFSISRFSLADRSPLSDNMWVIIEK